MNILFFIENQPHPNVGGIKRITAWNATCKIPKFVSDKIVEKGKHFLKY